MPDGFLLAAVFLLDHAAEVRHGVRQVQESLGRLAKLAEKAAEDGAEFVTVFCGEDVSEEQAQTAEEIFAQACPDAELSVLPGGQPVYYYIVSIE